MNDKLQQIIANRRKKLEQIKDLIPLKTYHAIEEKLSLEAGVIVKSEERKEQQIERENKVQALPKAFFEQRYLKLRNIRID